MNIRDLEFKPDCPDEALERGKSWLYDNYERFSGRANFAIVSINKENEVKLQEYVGNNCHGILGNPWALPPNRVCIVNDNASKRRWGEVFPEGVLEFHNWFVSESDFSRFILFADPSFGFIFSSDVPCTVLQNMNIISRHFWECGEPAFKAFKEITSLGYSGNAAYGFCFNTNISRCYNTFMSGNYPPFDFEKEQITAGGAQHRAWDFWFSKDSFQNFLSGQFGIDDHQPEVHFRNTSTIYGGARLCNNTWAARDFIQQTVEEDENLRKKLAEFRKAGGPSVPVVSNPFVRKQPNNSEPTRVNYKELIEVFLPHIKEKGILDVS